MRSQLRSRLRPARSQVEPIFLSPDDAMARLNNLLIVDVQNPKYATSVLPKSHRLNVDTFLKDLPKTQPILLTCLTGQRSLTAAQQLIRRGYDAVYVLKGGVMAWKQAGHTVQLIKISA